MLAALIGPPASTAFALPSARTHVAMRAPVLRMDNGDEDEDELNFDMGLLKLPRLQTPQQASFDRYRKRRQEDTMRGFGKPGTDVPSGKTPLGLDPVEGDPVDLSAYDETGMGMPVTDEEAQAAEEDFRRMAQGGSFPDDLGDDIDRLLGRK